MTTALSGSILSYFLQGEPPIVLVVDDEAAIRDQWISQWRDLIDFEVLPVLSSAEVQARLGGRL